MKPAIIALYSAKHKMPMAHKDMSARRVLALFALPEALGVGQAMEVKTINAITRTEATSTANLL